MELTSPWLDSRGNIFNCGLEVNDPDLPDAAMRLEATGAQSLSDVDTLAVYVAELLTVSEYNPHFGVQLLNQVERPQGKVGTSSESFASEEWPVVRGSDQDVVRRTFKPHVSPECYREVERKLLTHKGGPFVVKLFYPQVTKPKESLYKTLSAHLCDGLPCESDRLESRCWSEEEEYPSRNETPHSVVSSDDEDAGDDDRGVEGETSEVILTRSLHRLLTTVESAGHEIGNIHENLGRLPRSALQASVHRMACYSELIVRNTLHANTAVVEIRKNGSEGDGGGGERGASEFSSSSSKDDPPENSDDIEELKFSLNWYINFGMIRLRGLTCPSSFSPAPPPPRSAQAIWEEAYDIFCALLIMSSFLMASPKETQCYIIAIPSDEDTYVPLHGDVVAGLGPECLSIVKKVAKRLQHHFSQTVRSEVNPDWVLSQVEDILDIPLPRGVSYGPCTEKDVKQAIDSLSMFLDVKKSLKLDFRDCFGLVSTWRRSMYLSLSEGFVQSVLTYYDRAQKSLFLRTADYCVRHAGPKIRQSDKATEDLETIQKPISALLLPFISVDVVLNLKKCQRRLYRVIYRNGNLNPWLHQKLYDVCKLIELLQLREQRRPLCIPPDNQCPWLDAVGELNDEKSSPPYYTPKVSPRAIHMLRTYLERDVFAITRKLQVSTPVVPLTHYEAQLCDSHKIPYEMPLGLVNFDKLASDSSEKAMKEIAVSLICRWLDYLTTDLRNVVVWNLVSDGELMGAIRCPPLGNASYQWKYRADKKV